MLLTWFMLQIYTPIQKGSPDKQRTRAYPVIEQAYVESTGYCIEFASAYSVQDPLIFCS